MQPNWQVSIPEQDFSQRMENAFRRAAGSINYDLAKDRGNTGLLKERAGRAFEVGAGMQPMFMRIGSSALALAGYKPGGTIDIKNCGGEILKEFYDEGKAGYLAAKSSFRIEASARLKELGLEAKQIEAILDSADQSFNMPSQESFTSIGLEFCKGGIAPSTLAAFAGVLAFLPLIMLLRSPFIAIPAGLLAGGFCYYLSRSANRRKAGAVLSILPRRLYDNLLSGLKTNARRYSETINSATAYLNTGS